MQQTLSVIVLGATGAVGGEAVRGLLELGCVERVTTLNRRPIVGLSDQRVTQHTVDVLDPATYRALIPGHQAAICTLGVGQPSKMTREEFLRVDKDAVLAFAKACKAGGVEHFELLGAVGANARSRAFYLRVKGELEEGLRALNFRRLSLFRPSMILTPQNRYGLQQGITLAVWPLLRPALLGPLRKLRGVRVERLGRAMARNLLTTGEGVEVLHWDEFERIS